MPMHISGLLGMPRRIWTYSEASGWGPFNLVSTLGAYLIGLGVLVFIIDLMRNFRVGPPGQLNPWQAGTLEWLPTDLYSTRTIPHVTSREPLWSQSNLSEEVEVGQHYLPNAPTGARETIVTSVIEAKPQYVIQMPGNGWGHVLAAVFTAACFLLLTIKVVVPAIICAVMAVVCILAWVWELDKGPGKGPVDIGAGIKLPVYVTGPIGHGWWAMVILMVVAASLYLTYLFSYLYLWTVSPKVWPSDPQSLPDLQWPVLSALLFIAGAAFFTIAGRTLAEPGHKHAGTPLWVLLGAFSSIAAVCLAIGCHWQVGLRPSASSYGALVYMDGVLTGQLVFAVLMMSLFVIARHLTGKLDRIRCATLENTRLLVYYTAAQALVGLLLIHGFPRMIL
jgi:cytochrome c oxidase subunit I+III